MALATAAQCVDCAEGRRDAAVRVSYLDAGGRRDRTRRRSASGVSGAIRRGGAGAADSLYRQAAPLPEVATR